MRSETETSSFNDSKSYSPRREETATITSLCRLRITDIKIQVQGYSSEADHIIHGFLIESKKYIKCQ